MIGSWDEALKSMQHHLLNKLDGKVDETPERFLQLEIRRKDGNIYLHKTDYCKPIINMVYQATTKTVHTPLGCGTPAQSDVLCV